MGAKVRAIKRRMRSVASTRKITKAFELIAASRIIKAQTRATAARPYADAIGEMVAMLASEARSSPLLAERQEIRTVGLVTITADRGLCGAYNSNVLREAERARRREKEANREVQITAVGRKGLSFYRFRRIPMAGEFSGVSDRPTYDDAKRIAASLIEQFTTGGIDKLFIAYTEFASTFVQRPKVAQVLPARVDEAPAGGAGHEAAFEYEPEPAALLEGLLPRYVEMKVYAALLESAASEHAARRRAMRAASDNADDLMKLLELTANQARQSEITAEIADIVGGAEALRQKKEAQQVGA
jgi:F-type H+-transporting ATPase subunit gamma